MVATPTRRPMSPFLMYAADAAAILVLILLFVRRHGRRDLVAAYLGVNVGVGPVRRQLPHIQRPDAIGSPRRGPTAHRSTRSVNISAVAAELRPVP
jgi:hypothetical protein